jgi:hypothetical protein
VSCDLARHVTLVAFRRAVALNLDRRLVSFLPTESMLALNVWSGHGHAIRRCNDNNLTGTFPPALFELEELEWWYAACLAPASHQYSSNQFKCDAGHRRHSDCTSHVGQLTETMVQCRLLTAFTTSRPTPSPGSV